MKREISPAADADDPRARFPSGHCSDRQPFARAVVEHPDDPVLGGGALLARLAQAAVLDVADGAPRGCGDFLAERPGRTLDWPRWLDRVGAAVADLGREPLA